MIHARADYNRIQDPAKKIAADEPVFLLRAKDKLMPEVTAYWAQRLREEGGDEHMVEMANNHVFLAKEWQQKNGCRLPDIPEDISNTSDTTTFSLEQVLNLLLSLEQGLNPECFKSSKELDTVDFLDLARCKASELGISKVFEKYLDDTGEYIRHG